MTVSTDVIGRGWSFPLRFSKTGGVEKAAGIDLLKMSIRQILMTRIGTRVPLREFGSPLRDLIFSPIQPDLGTFVEHFVREAIERWEKRVEVRTIRADLTDWKDGRLAIAISFVVRATSEAGNLVVPFMLTAEDRAALGFSGGGGS